MQRSAEIFTSCDVLEALPLANRANWLFELDLLAECIPANSTVLQVGCMDGTRIVALQRRRPDLGLSGLDIDEDLLDLARDNFKGAQVNAKVIHRDVTVTIRETEQYDFVICLNNTLGYIENEDVAIRNMRAMSRECTIISVYGEKFTEVAARDYFAALGAKLLKFHGDGADVEGLGRVRRFPRNHVERWKAGITETPLGYFCALSKER